MHCDRIPFFELRGTYATEATAAPAATEAAAAPEATPEEVLQLGHLTTLITTYWITSAYD